MTAYVQKVFFDVPELPAGFNSVAVNGDELNGPGIWEISPSLSLSAESYTVQTLDAADLASLDCVTMTIAPENRRIGIAEQDRTIHIVRRCAA
jgi:hypothetical protein